MNQLLQQLPDFVCQFDHDGRMTYLNPAGRRRLGLALDASLDGWSYQRILPGWKPDFLSALPRQAVNEGSWVGSSELKEPQGATVLVSNSVLVHRGARGDIETVSMVLRDMPAPAQPSREYGRDEAIMRAVADVATTMIGVLDREQRFLFLNRAFERQFNVRREDWIGRLASELYEPEEYASNLPLLEEALGGKLVVHEETFTDGEDTLVLEMQYSPLECTSGEIEGIVWIARDITHTRAEEAKLRSASLTDPLTKVLNRAGFDHGAKEKVAEARAQGHLLALLCLDLDGFKPVNDKYGHPVGDALLCAVVGRLRDSLRALDLVARLGGDEFVILLSSVSAVEHVEAVAAKLVETISRPFLIDKQRITVGVSIGYCAAPSDLEDVPSMLAQADAWLYEAKRAGRGVYRGGRYSA